MILLWCILGVGFAELLYLVYVAFTDRSPSRLAVYLVGLGTLFILVGAFFVPTEKTAPPPCCTPCSAEKTP